MSKINYFYDIRTFKAYKASELQFLSNDDKRFIRMVPNDGIVQNGVYYQTKKRNIADEEIQQSINIVNNKKGNSYQMYVDEGKKIANYLTRCENTKFNSIEEIVTFIYNNIYDNHKEKSLINYNKNEIIKEVYSYVLNQIYNNNPSFTSLIVNNENIENAWKKSKSDAKINRKNNSKAKNLAIRSVSTILALVTITTGAFAIKSYSKQRKVSNAIAALTYDSKDKDMINYYIETNKLVSAVGQNTYRAKNPDNHWYKNEDIAKDLMKLPEYAFLSGIADTFYGMYPYIDNLDKVINYLNKYSQNTPSSPSFKYTNDCKDLGDFLIKNGWYTYADNTVIPDLDGFLKYIKEYNLKNSERFVDDATEHMEELTHGR